MAMSTDFKAMSKMNINPGLSIITEREELDNMAESNSAVPLSGNDVSSNHSDDFGPKNGKMSHVGKTMMGEDRKVKEKLRKTLLTGKSEAQIRKEERLEQIRAKRDQEEAERLAEEAERLAKIEWKRKKRLAKEELLKRGDPTVWSDFSMEVVDKTILMSDFGFRKKRE